MKKVHVILASIQKYSEKPLDRHCKRKVAGYARVSTDHDDQVTSYEAQVDYYTHYIKSRSDWEFIGMYTDEGISATNTKYREGFKRMIEDALSGKIDLIITKSVSRFARNTVDSLMTVRKLKDKGIEIYFEKENIWTLDAKGELLITIMSSLAQEESRSISENVTWGHRKRFADGKVSLAYSHFLGYERGVDGNLVINKEQAETVKEIYRLFLSGFTYHSIARKLTEKGIKSPAGKDSWCAGTVRSILTNEKYKGDALLQKRLTVNFLTKEMKINEGEVPQYYVEHNHEAIISPQVFDLVQEEILKRKSGKTRYSGVSIFSTKIKCGHCGSWYGAKIWHSNDSYRREIYQCNSKFKNHCNTPHLTAERIKEIFVSAVNKLITNKNEIIENLEMIRQQLCQTKSLEKEREHLKQDMLILSEIIKKNIAENARIAQNQNEYEKKYDDLMNKYNKMKNNYEIILDKIKKQQVRNTQIGEFIDRIKKQDTITEFNEYLWASLVDFITVYNEQNIRITFRDGTEIKV